MDDDEDWGPALIMQTTEDVARAVVAVAAAASAVTAPRSPRPSVVFSTKDEGGNQLQKLQNQVTRVIKGLKHPPEVKIGGYNPEVLTTLKRQWTSIQMRSLDHRIWKEPSRLFESMVVVGIHPNCDIRALQQQYIGRKSEGSGRFRTVLGGGQHQLRVEPNLEPQVLFVYPPEKQLPLKYKDLRSFCFPAGVEVHAIEKNPSKSELNEILIGQEHLKQSDLSFVFRLQVADDSTLYGCCVLVDELIQNPSGLISMISDGQPPRLPLSRHILTTRRCYCILSRVPCFELHFGVLNSIFTEERLERLTKSISQSDLDGQEENLAEVSRSISPTNRKEGTLNGIIETSQSSTTDSIPGKVLDGKCHLEHQKLEKRVDDNVVPTDPKTEESPAEKETLVAAQISKTCDTFVDNVVPVDPKTEDLPAEKESLVGSQISNACDTFVDTVVAIDPKTEDLTAEKESLVPSQISEACDTSFDNVVPIDPKTEAVPDEKESLVAAHISKACDTFVEDVAANKQSSQWRSPNTVLPLLRHQQHESSDSSSSFQGSPEDRNSRCDAHEAEIEEASFSGQSSDHGDILEWAKANGHGSLQIISEYYQLRCPERGSKIKFHPLEHLHPLEFHRPDETVLHVAGSTIELKYCRTSLEMAEAHNALMAEEEATALSVWAVACLCGSFRLEHVLTLFAGALLEKKIVVVCSNLGVLSACVLSIIPLIRPYQWQSFLMPVLPNDMLDFLDAPVPYIVGVKNKAAEFQSMLTNVVLVDANKNQVKSSTIPQLPRQKELFSSLSPYHAKLVGESYLGRKRPVHACTDVQVEAAKGFLAVLRSYLDSLCSNMRSHTITNVQSNDDKVSLLLKESFIESFPSRDRPFMKLFLDTQLFSVHTDLVLSFFQKD